MWLFGYRLETVCVASEPPPRLVFLDFDGVVHPLVGGDVFLPRCVGCVNDIVEALDARIVLSTAWRGSDWDRYNDLSHGRIIGHTPELGDLSARYLRYQEIRGFLRATGWETVPWLALDDMPEMFPPGADPRLARRHTPRHAHARPGAAASHRSGHAGPLPRHRMDREDTPGPG